MALLDFAALENAELDAYVDFYRAAPEDAREAYAVGVREIGIATWNVNLSGEQYNGWCRQRVQPTAFQARGIEVRVRERG